MNANIPGPVSRWPFSERTGKAFWQSSNFGEKEQKLDEMPFPPMPHFTTAALLFPPSSASKIKKLGLLLLFCSSFDNLPWLPFYSFSASSFSFF